MPLLLEIFCGTKSVGREFEEAEGWEVYSVDIDPSRNTTWTGDVREFDPATLPRRPDMIWASPVCTQCSVCRSNAKTPRDLA
jgi:site-specific DNA-cytosine methylase